MKIEKEKCKVRIFFQDGSSMKGYIHINLGERIIDFINDNRETFIALTSIQMYYVKSFKLSGKLVEKKDFIVLNKNSIKWIEEEK